MTTWRKKRHLVSLPLTLAGNGNSHYLPPGDVTVEGDYWKRFPDVLEPVPAEPVAAPAAAAPAPLPPPPPVPAASAAPAASADAPGAPTDAPASSDVPAAGTDDQKPKTGRKPKN